MNFYLFLLGSRFETLILGKIKTECYSIMTDSLSDSSCIKYTIFISNNLQSRDCEFTIQEKVLSFEDCYEKRGSEILK